MKIWILSDLHNEMTRSNHAPLIIRPPDVDVAIFAGDIHTAALAIGSARRLAGPELPIIIIAGNHEHYRSGMAPSEAIALMRAQADDQTNAGFPTYFLENQMVYLKIHNENVRFIGSTLWVDFGLFGDPVVGARRAMVMNDFRLILSDLKETSSPVVLPGEMAQWFAASRRYIEKELRTPFNGKTVVVTHHLPSFRSVHAKYKTDPVTAGFASRCDDLLALGADLWVHGHTHASCDYVDEKTRVICNPRGYWPENSSFNPGLVVDLSYGCSPVMF